MAWPDDLRRDADGGDSSGQILRDYAASADDGTVADVDSLQDGDVSTQPHTIADDGFPFNESQTGRSILAVGNMIVIGDVTERANHTVLPNSYGVACVDNGLSVDITALTDS